jgi:hypothetical protein
VTSDQQLKGPSMTDMRSTALTAIHAMVRGVCILLVALIAFAIADVDPSATLNAFER